MENSGRIKKDAWLPSPGWADAAAMPVYCSFFSRYSFRKAIRRSISSSVPTEIRRELEMRGLFQCLT